MSKQRQIGVTFTKRNLDLLEWAISEAERQRRPIAWIGQDAFDCLRAVQQHASGLTWQEWLTKADQALTLLEREHGSLEWAIASYVAQRMENEE